MSLGRHFLFYEVVEVAECVVGLEGNEMVVGVAWPPCVDGDVVVVFGQSIATFRVGHLRCVMSG